MASSNRMRLPVNKTVIAALAATYLITCAPDTEAHAVHVAPPAVTVPMATVLVKGHKRPAISYRRVHPRPDDKLVGRVPPNRQQQANDAAAALAILGIVGLGVGLAIAGRGHGGVPLASGSGCGNDYTHKNPMGCGGTVPTPQGSNGPPGPYKCQGSNGWYVSRTFRSGCYMSSMDQPGGRMSDSLR